MHDDELRRFSALLQAFVDLASGRTDLQLRGSAEPPPLGFAVRLQPEPTSPGSELTLWTDGAKLSTWSGDGQHPLNGHDDRYVHLDLSRGYLWGGETFGGARELAGMLVRWMEREITPSGWSAGLEVQRW